MLFLPSPSNPFLEDQIYASISTFSFLLFCLGFLLRIENFPLGLGIVFHWDKHGHLFLCKFCVVMLFLRMGRICAARKPWYSECLALPLKVVWELAGESYGHQVVLWLFSFWELEQNYCSAKTYTFTRQAVTTGNWDRVAMVMRGCWDVYGFGRPNACELSDYILW